MDLELLAPYISMDDDFQLTFLSNLPEEGEKWSSPLSEPSSATPAVKESRKRYDRSGPSLRRISLIIIFDKSMIT